MNRRHALAAFVLAAAMSLQGCAGQRTHALTEADAQRLAVMRFNNFRDGFVTVHSTLPSGAGVLVIDGRLDFGRAIGYARLRTQGRDDRGSAGVIQWTPSAVAFPVDAGQATDPPPAGDWQIRQLQRAGGELDTTLALLLGLASDRPDNAQLLRQSGARWLHADSLDGADVDVYEGPRPSGAQPDDQSRLRYWINQDDQLRRVDARIGSSGATAEIDLATGAKPFEPITALASRSDHPW